MNWLFKSEAAPDDARLTAARESWLSANPAHVAAYARAQEVWRLTGEAGPAKAAPVDAHPTIVDRLSVSGLAAGLAACLIFAAAAPRLGLLMRADYVTSAGETRDIALSDGTRLTLDADSAIAVDLAGRERSVTLLNGQAFFRVMHDVARPFRVHAGDVTIADIGTAFDVKLQGAAIRVAVASGAVSLAAPPSQIETLNAGEQIWIGRDLPERGKVAPDRVASWRWGKLAVQNATVADVAAELGAYRSGVVLVTDAALARKRVTGIFDLHDTDRSLESLSQPFHARVRYLTPYLVLVSAN